MERTWCEITEPAPYSQEGKKAMDSPTTNNQQDGTARKYEGKNGDILGEHESKLLAGGDASDWTGAERDTD